MSFASSVPSVSGLSLSGGEKVVVLSDIHIGDNSPTVWYQASVHEQYLVGILDWVAQESLISEVVLLGDIVDFWTYPFSTPPPTFEAISAANPNVFGPHGALARLLDAKGGAVTYVEGNHDFGVTAADVARITSPGGYKVRFGGSEYRVDGQGNQGILFSHGHAYTMFNAPDPTSPWQITPQSSVARGLPVGHFVTRMVATKWARDLAAGGTVAQLPGQGAPNGIGLSGIIQGIISHGGDVSIARALLDSVAAQTGCGPNDPIILPFGLGTTTLAHVQDIYANLWTEWVKAAPAGQGELRAAKAAIADAGGTYLGWFAQMRAFESVADAMIMGHTHSPIMGLQNSLITYANCGFECPSVPDMGRQFMSFVLVDVADLSTQVLRISSPPGQGLQIDTCPASSTSVVVSPAQDFSCYVIIENTLQENLLLQSTRVGNGYFPVPPPAKIAPGKQAMIWLQDKPGLHGSDATFIYAAGGRSFEFTVDCPTGVYSNVALATGGATFRTKYGSHQNWGPIGKVDPWRPFHPSSDPMHPFFVLFTV
jgi:UDP-2,3-diacylglucosamine pyrophosphatase LpxH